MKAEAVTASYRRWAPIYDATFGRITNEGRRRATAYLNRHGGRLLEVGVGTGLSLPHYGHNVRVTGFDFSAEMLAKAKEKVSELGLTNVEGLHRMDARALDFPDASFDCVTAMHVLSVVPEPARVVGEMARVCRPGGHIVIVNHFSAEGGVMGHLERLASPLEDLLGWQSDFPISQVLANSRLKLIEREKLPPLGMMTWLVMERV